jgi:DNA adenine methylase
MESLVRYPGNKSVLGLYQFIINRIPECSTMIEAFAGSGAITKKIQSMATTDENNYWRLGSGQLVRTILNDCNPGVCEQLKKSFPEATVITNFTAVTVLNSIPPVSTDIFIYCDPPYKLSTRGSERRIYKYEMSDNDHAEFLTAAATVKANCMISHYECPMYDQALPGWHKEKFKVSYHGNVKEECIYYNYPKPSKLLTYQYVGSDCWDRQRVTRKIERLVKKLNALPELEKNAVLSRVINRLT